MYKKREHSQVGDASKGPAVTAGSDSVSQLQRGPAAPSVGRLLDDVGGERVVAGDADGVAGQRVPAPPWRFATGEAQVAQRGEEDLAVGGRHQVVEDGVDGRAHVEENVGQHVEVVVEVVQTPARTRTTGGGQRRRGHMVHTDKRRSLHRLQSAKLPFCNSLWLKIHHSCFSLEGCV